MAEFTERRSSFEEEVADLEETRTAYPSASTPVKTSRLETPANTPMMPVGGSSNNLVAHANRTTQNMSAVAAKLFNIQVK